MYRYQRYPIAKQAAPVTGAIGLTTSGVPIFSNSEFDEATMYPTFDTCGGAPDSGGQVRRHALIVARLVFVFEFEFDFHNSP